MAGGMGWGIRGQYGHESGAMIAGLLVSAVIAVGYLSHLPSLFVARAMAMATIAIGIGGSMTYGQTIGLTHDKELIGNLEAWRWGMLGLSIKGAIWIGLAGLMLGHALSGKMLSPFKMCLLVVTMWALHLLGVWLINQPYDPTKRLLPEIYFSADWYWKPEAGPELKPRREVWGGLGLALLLSMLGLRILVGDRLAFRMASWGILGGAIGFPAGQSLQAYHAWHLPDFQTATWLPWDRVLNWWNIMETTYGFIMGGCLTLGVLLNRHLIAEDDASPNVEAAGNKLGSMPWPVALGLEGVLLSLHVALLVGSELIPQCGVGWYGNGLVMAAIPLVAVCAGRFWPYYLLLPVTIIPIAGKTFRETALTKFDGNMEVVKEAAVSMPVAVIAFLVVPIVLTWVLAGWWSRTQLQVRPAQHFAPVLLLAVTWLYFGLNFASFSFHCRGYLGQPARQMPSSTLLRRCA